MSLAVSFSTIPELFVELTKKYSGSARNMLMRKVDGVYKGLTYDEVRAQVLRCALGLKALGIQKGDKLAIISENRPEWVIFDMAVLSLGAVDVPLYPSQTAKQIEYILNDADVVAIAVSNQFQLSKVMKVKSKIKSLKTVVVFNTEGFSSQESVVTLEGLLADGNKDVAGNEDFLERNARNIQAQDLCTLIYTSGTTGDPKGVMLSHNNFASNINGASDILPLSDTDVMLSFLPLSHVFERTVGYYFAIAAGICIAYAESIETVAENLREVRPTIVVAVPRLFERIYNRIARLVEKDSPLKRKIFYWAVGAGRKFIAAKMHGKVSASLSIQHRIADKLVFSKLKARTGGRIRFFVSGGAALPRELGEFFEAVGILIIEGYGLTESSPMISANSIESHKFGSVGHALPNVEVKIAEDGEILSRGEHIMKGYYNDKKSTEEAIDKDGWLHTGDIGVLDENNFLYITDRKKHLFVSSGGKNIAPQPIENMFATTDFIEQFVLIGDSRMFLTALIYPDFDYLRNYADSHEIEYSTNADLANDSEIYSMIEQTIRKKQRDLPNYERIRKFAILENPLTIENGELTPTMKIKRKAVEERYGKLIEEMYHNIG